MPEQTDPRIAIDNEYIKDFCNPIPDHMLEALSLDNMLEKVAREIEKTYWDAPDLTHGENALWLHLAKYTIKYAEGRERKARVEVARAAQDKLLKVSRLITTYQELLGEALLEVGLTIEKNTQKITIAK